YNALRSGDQSFNRGQGAVCYFDEEVSPFVGFDYSLENGFDLLHQQLPQGRKILYATPGLLKSVAGWQILVAINGLQFVYQGKRLEQPLSALPIPLQTEHVSEMVQLATLTKPGPFGKRTITFGHYHGIFSEGRLVAMTGQRLHVQNYTEISAVCTHPDHLGKGYAAALLQHQVNFILDQGKHPFLHVRADNTRAINIYERLGFTVSRGMNFYFMKKIG
ncbi:MAG: GNAT family N-acetyltransferase, partial [Pedobacter sp.]